MVGTSHRASAAPFAARSRMSTVSGGGLSHAAAQRLAAKQAELHALQQLRYESSNLVAEMTTLSERIDTLVAGGSGALET